MNKKTLILSAILLLLLGGAWWAMKSKGAHASTGYDYLIFTVQDTASVKRVFLADRQGNQALIERAGKHWFYTNKVTGKKYAASPKVVALMLETLAQQRVRMRVPLSAEKTVVEELATVQTKVEIYEGGDTPTKSFYIGQLAVNETGSNAIMEGEDTPYIVFVPGFDGEIRPRFPSTESAWRDKAVFRYSPNEIKEVSIQYTDPAQQNFSFKMLLNGNGTSVTPLGNSPQYQPEQLRKLNVDDYIKGFNALIAESAATNASDRDSVLVASHVFCNMTIISADGVEKNIKLFPVTPKVNYAEGKDHLTSREDIKRYLAVVNNGEEGYYVQQQVAKKYLVSYGYFYGKE